MTEPKRPEFKLHKTPEPFSRPVTKEMMDAQYEHHLAYMADPMREQRLFAHRMKREAEIDAILNPPRGWLTRWLFG